jgi:phosphoglycerate dehydrogenase-like enzyme
MPRIVIPDDDPPVVSLSDAYSKLDESEVRAYLSRPRTPEELVERIQDAEFVINVRARTRFTWEVLRRCGSLKLISVWGTGTDNVDLAAARELGIRVANTPGVSAIAVAEHALMLILAVARQIVQVDRQVREGNWPRAMVTQLHGKTLGLIGTGAIGREMARLGRGVGCRIIAWTFHPAGTVAEWVRLEDVFRLSDIVSVHVRQSPETTGMIRREHFEMMQPKAIFINTARGAIVHEPDLIHALRTGRIAGAGLDVFESEPLPSNSPFLTLSNVVLTPHSAGITPEATEAGIAMAIENIFQFIDGHPTRILA